jgi:hypothetical protein
MTAENVIHISKFRLKFSLQTFQAPSVVYPKICFLEVEGMLFTFTFIHFLHTRRRRGDKSQKSASEDGRSECE